MPAHLVVTGYFDESGSHSDSPVTLLAGYVGDARQWRKFEKRVTKLFSRYGVKKFHAVEIRNSQGDFSDWSVDKKLSFIDDLTHIANETLEKGCCAIITDADFKNCYSNFPFPAGVTKHSKYGLLVRSVVASAIDFVLSTQRWRDGPQPRLRIVLEAGHKNTGDASTLYSRFKERLDDFHQGALDDLTFKTKDECIPLAIADLLAYGAYLQETGGKTIGTPKTQPKSELSYRGNVIRVPLIPDSLRSIIQSDIAIFARKRR